VASALRLHHAVLVPETEVRPVAECVAQITGLPLPDPLPTVMRSSAWSFRPDRDCCNRDDGERIAGPATRTAGGSYANRVLAFYFWNPRIIVLSASADRRRMAHELANDMAAQAATHPLSIADRHRLDVWAYDIDARYHVARCAP